MKCVQAPMVRQGKEEKSRHREPLEHRGVKYKRSNVLGYKIKRWAYWENSECYIKCPDIGV